MTRFLNNVDNRVKTAVDKQTFNNQNTYAARKQLEKSVLNFNELLLKMDETNNKISDDIQKTELQLKTYISEVICERTNLSKSESNSQYVDKVLDNNSYDDELELSDISDKSLDSLTMSEKDGNYQWLYVASSNSNFCEYTLRNYIKKEFRVNDLKIQALSNNVSATYKSFKILVRSYDVSTFMDLRNWPGCTYIRAFETKKNAVPRSHGWRSKDNFIHNPLKSV